MGTCQNLFIVLVCITLGIVAGVWLSHEYNINGLPDLWAKLTDIFRKTADQAQQAIKDKLNNSTTNTSNWW